MKREIRIKEHKSVSSEVTQTMVDQLFVAPTYDTKWFTVDHLITAKRHLDESENINDWLAKPTLDPVLKTAIEALKLYNNDKLIDTLNTLDADRDHFGVVVGKLTDRLEVPVVVSHKEFNNAQIRAYMAYQLLTILVDTEIAFKKSENSWIVNEETGKGEWKVSEYLSFGKPKTSNKYYTKGLATEPGVVLQKRYKVQAGGKPRKLNKVEKQLLGEAASFKMKVVDIPLDILESYMKHSEWYVNVLDGKVKMDKIQADEIVKLALEKYVRIQALGGFYLPMWMDYRTRLYYFFTQLGLNPHGGHFETSMFEAYDSYMIKEIEEYLYSAVVLIDGRMPHHIAVDKYNANPEHYQAQLRRTDLTKKLECGRIIPDHGGILYNTRLADAIQSYYNGEETNFLLGEDATNGGLQHGGIGFHSEGMMVPSNVGGAPEQRDSHGDLQTRLGLDSRDTAKDIHQPLLHGSSMATVAKVLGIAVRETEEMLQIAYGKEVFNIESIANWGVAAANNDNTTLCWKTADGFNAQSIAYVETVPLNLRALSDSTDKGWTQILIQKDMPLLLDRQGRPVYGKTTPKDKKSGGDVKVRGLYANITHSIDATALRNIIRAMHKIGKGGLWKHDNFLVPGNMELVRHTYRDSLLVEFDLKLYDQALADIVSNYKGTSPTLPTLSYGNATRDMIINSHYYLAP